MGLRPAVSDPLEAALAPALASLFGEALEGVRGWLRSPDGWRAVPEGWFAVGTEAIGCFITTRYVPAGGCRAGTVFLRMECGTRFVVREEDCVAPMPTPGQEEFLGGLVPLGTEWVAGRLRAWLTCLVEAGLPAEPLMSVLRDAVAAQVMES